MKDCALDTNHSGQDSQMLVVSDRRTTSAREERWLPRGPFPLDHSNT
jgi:hypothetical protein